jgi:HEAT repeat protein
MWNERRKHMTALALAFAALVVGRASVATAAEAESSDERQQPLIEVLLSDASKAEKAITCKKLILCGDKRAVPALAPLLADEELASWARIPLEAIPGPEADAALREAMANLEGRLLIGVINSIGVRRDGEAIAGLAGKLTDSDASVASAAAEALGKIGGAAASKALETALAGSRAEVRSAAAKGLIRCAEQALGAGDRAEAVRQYGLVRQADVPRQRVVEGTLGEILARGPDGLPLLLEQLQSDDKVMFYVALRAARELGGPDVTQAVVAELDRLRRAGKPEAAGQDLPPNPRESALIYALGDLGGAAALSAVREAAGSGATDTRVSAVRVLGEIGDASVVPVLLEAAQGTGELAAAALKSLNKLEGDAIDEAIVRGLADATGQRRATLIQVVGSRRIESAVSELVKAAEADDTAVRLAAIRALGRTVGFDRLDVLIGRLCQPRDAQEAQTTKSALLLASTRMPDRDATAAKLLGEMRDASTESQTALLELVKEVGGARALAGVAAAARGREDAMRDAGSRLLGEWMDPTAAPVLLDLAKTAPENKYRVRALRGYLRIARQFNVPLEDRIGMCEAALKIAQRPDEKKLALQVLGQHSSTQGLALAVGCLGDPALRDDAGTAATAIAERIFKQDPAAAVDAMRRVIAAGGDRQVVDRANAVLKQAEQRLKSKR